MQPSGLWVVGEHHLHPASNTVHVRGKLCIGRRSACSRRAKGASRGVKRRSSTWSGNRGVKRRPSTWSVSNGLALSCNDVKLME